MEPGASALVVPFSPRCSFCGLGGCVRCMVCKFWYCSASCQANHWPVHRRECLPLPGLEWPDGSRYLGQLEGVRKTGQLEIENKGSDEESMNMKEMLVGRVRIEDQVDLHSNRQQVVEVKVLKSDVQTIENTVRVTATNKLEVALVEEKFEKISVSKPTPTSVPGMLQDAKLINTVPAEAKQIQVAKPEIIPAKSSAIQTKPVVPRTKPVSKTTKPVMISNKAAVNLAKPGGSSVNIEVLASKPQPATVKPVDIKSTPNVPSKPAETLVKLVHSQVEPVASPEVIQPKPVVNTTTDVAAVVVPKPDVVQAAGVSYVPAHQSTTLPAQAPPPPGSYSQIVLPVEDLVSPSEFCVRLASDDAALIKLLEGMNENPPLAVPGWAVGRRETVAVYFEDIWYRGLAVKKTEGKFAVYLLDFGGALVIVSPDKLRPLPASLVSTPAVMYQVCLAGAGPVEGDAWGEEVGQLMGEIVNADIQYKLGVEFVGQVEGGRWLVKLKGIEDDEDIGSMLLDAELVKSKKDVMIHSISTSFATNNEHDVSVASSNTEQPKIVTKVALAEEAQAAIAGPKIPRGVLPVNTTIVVGVCFLDTPDKFYVCPSTAIDKFMDILSSAQSAPPGTVSPVVGSSCLAMDEKCWYRAEVVKLNSDNIKATVFLLDYGKTIVIPVFSLRPITSSLVTTPGLVCLVTLRGVQPVDSIWSKDEVAGALLVMDVGGETQFNVKNVEVVDKWITIVSMEDTEGNDVADLMVETGIAVRDETMMGVLKLVPGILTPGKQQLLVLSALSPMDINLCTQEQFLYFSETIVPLVEKSAAKAELVLSPKEGDILLAYEDQVWYRATVVKLVPGDAVQVMLVDLAVITTLPRDKLRVAEVAVMKDPVVAVSCCLDTWVEEDRKVALEKWGDKMEGMLEQYSELDVEVIEVLGTQGQGRVKIPNLEKKLGKKDLSRAEMLKMKLKQKK